jgi:hypothetical protein
MPTSAASVRWSCWAKPGMSEFLRQVAAVQVVDGGTTPPV